MTNPRTPAEVIRDAAQRHATARGAAQALSAEVAAKRQSESEAQAKAGPVESP